jgi:hypothetical protein
LEGIGAMAEELGLAQSSISDREELKEVDHDREAALPASTGLADGGDDAIARRLDELKRLEGQIDPGASHLLDERHPLRDAPKMRWLVGPLLPERPDLLELGIEKSLGSASCAAFSSAISPRSNALSAA